MANEALLQVQRQREQTLQRASAEFDKAEKEARQEWFSAVKNFGEKQPFQSWVAMNICYRSVHEQENSFTANTKSSGAQVHTKLQ